MKDKIKLISKTITYTLQLIANPIIFSLIVYFLLSKFNISKTIRSNIVIMPIFEEIVFRKLLQGRLERIISQLSAMIIQSMIFSVLHLTNFLFIFLTAISFTLITKWSGNLTTSIICHMITNFIAMCLFKPFYKFACMPIIVVISAMVVIVTIIIMYKNKKYSFKDNNNSLYDSKCI